MESAIDHMNETGSSVPPTHGTRTSLDVYGLTHPGKVRPNNEDHFLICALKKSVQVYHTSLPDPSILGRARALAFLALVADGVGGAKAGEEASRITLEHVTRYVTRIAQLLLHERSRRRLATSSTSWRKRRSRFTPRSRLSATDPIARGMATTLTLWLGMWHERYLLQVGDSRCYILRDGELIQISRDQTMAEEFVKQGVFNREDAAFKQVGERSLERDRRPAGGAECDAGPQSWGSIGLMCSDGLTRHVSDEQIRDRLLHMKSARDRLRDASSGRARCRR